MFFNAFALCSLELFKLKTEGQTVFRKPHRKIPMKILAYPDLAKSSFEQPGPRATLLSLARSIRSLVN